MGAGALRESFASIVSTLGAHPVFVDTAAFYAVQTPNSSDHELGVKAWGALLARPTPLVTTNAVVGETYTLFRSRQGYAAAGRFLDWLDAAPSLRRHYVTETLEAQAYAILRQYRDHDFSYVDATSFAFMRSVGITEAFAFDAHFAIAGFVRIPLDRASDT